MSKTRSEIKKAHIDRLQENYNTVMKDYKTLQVKFEQLIDSSLDVVFSEFNDDVEMLARKLHKFGIIELKDGFYIFPKNRVSVINSSSRVDRKEVENDEL